MREGESRERREQEGGREGEGYIRTVHVHVLYKDILHVQCTHYMLVTCKYLVPRVSCTCMYMYLFVTVLQYMKQSSTNSIVYM